MKVMGRSSASLSSLHILTATQPKEKKKRMRRISLDRSQSPGGAARRLTKKINK
jgi:hypothetical protein